MNRRDFVKAVPGIAAAPAVLGETQPGNPYPRWRGFNLPGAAGNVPEDDFRMISDLGFDWVRLPESYWNLVDSDAAKTGTIDPKDVTRLKESALAEIDRLIEWGRKYSIHVNLALHRGPGFCISDYMPGRPVREPFNLWKDKAAEDAFVFYWDTFARRYKAIPNKDLSFNLLNEPMFPSPRPFLSPAESIIIELQNQARNRPRPPMSHEDHRRVMTRATGQIRTHTPDRIIILDGLDVGRTIIPDMIPAGVGQSVHTYLPPEVSHYRASWVDEKSDFPPPEWPSKRRDGKGLITRDTLETVYKPWGWLAANGIGVHAGECGCYSKTPHDVFLRWSAEVFDILKHYGIGWGLWNFRGDFGVLDSNRADVAYEDWHGHKLDRKLLTLLQYM
jgi:aryl-phospho-beta-D-glucosidase BglC (GH1 family)